MLRAVWQSDRGAVGSSGGTTGGRRGVGLGHDLLDDRAGRAAKTQFVSGRLAGRLGDWARGPEAGLDGPFRSRP